MISPVGSHDYKVCGERAERQHSVSMSRAVRETPASAVRVRFLAQPEVKRTSHPKRAMAPLQGARAKIEDAVDGISQKNSAIKRSFIVESGGDLLSRTVTSQVPSALKGLTSVFGMGTGGTPSSLPPEMVSYLIRTP